MSQLNLVGSTPVRLRRETPWFGSNPCDICTARLLDPRTVRTPPCDREGGHPRPRRPVCIARRSVYRFRQSLRRGVALVFRPGPRAGVLPRVAPPGVPADDLGTMTLSRATIPRPAIGSVTDARRARHLIDDPDAHPDASTLAQL